ncbi:MAG TPA: Gfo/Idh/MocA family oxidoreductase [Candidatus Binatia bacterium]|nr:Gfo/Idh/MocA family oxidoreductase [Candidatus Binatia bacterium]
MKNVSSTSRRTFLKHTAAAGAIASIGFPAIQAAESPGDKLLVGCMGLGRGLDHVNAILQISNVEIAYLCDIDDQRIERAAKVVGAKQERKPRGVKDFRRVLEDNNINALFIAAPNHWHAPATILACSAGKHVYVEKPGSHNAREGELMVQAARKNKRVVQMGNQRRSWPGAIEGIEKLRAGAIGKVLYARTSYNNARASIGRGKQVPVPENIDYSMWQGPAPERPYVDNLVHYNWHWRWHWGGGELANNGIHALDVVRWGLGVEYPTRVTYNGGRYHFDDDQETPDTGCAVYDFGKQGAAWDCSSCHPRRNEKQPFVTFYGSDGSLIQEGNGYKIFDPKGNEIATGTGPGGDKVHIQNFLDCIRSGQKPNSEIAEGQKSTLLCHLGNIAYRVGHTLHTDQKTGHILNDAEAQKLWSREYRPGWEPKV